MTLLGVQEPNIVHVPAGNPDIGNEAVRFVKWASMTLLPWQNDYLRDILLTQPNGMWSSRESVGIISRQNGKGEVLVARELVGVYLLGEKTILHTAHLMDTAQDAQARLWDIIENNPALYNWWLNDPETPGVPVNRVGNGKECIVFPNGARIFFRTRTKKTGRGLSVDLLIFDECYDLPKESYSAISKLTRAKRRAHTMYISSAVNREEHFHGEILSAKRWAAMDGANLMLLKEWSPDPDDDPFDIDTIAKCNPSLVQDEPFGAILEDLLAEAETAKKSSALLNSYMVESLAKGNWEPRDSDMDNDFVPIIEPEQWEEKTSVPLPYTDACLAVEADPEGDKMAMVMALYGKGKIYLSLNDVHDFDRKNVETKTLEYVNKHDPVALCFDPYGTLSTLVEPLRKANVEPELLNGSKVSQAYELLLTLWKEGKILHDGDERWYAALRVAKERSKNGRYRSIDRYSGDVSCLIAASIAVWGLVEFAIPETKPEVKQKVTYVGSAQPLVVTEKASDFDF